MSKFIERRMPTPTLSKKRAVLDLEFAVAGDQVSIASQLSGYPGYAAFRLDDEDTRFATVMAHLRHDDWEAMGSPEVITVTIEPGDRLNPQEKA